MHRMRTTLIGLVLGLGVSLGCLVTTVQAVTAITNPTPGSTLTTSTVTFTGGHTPGGFQHWANVGSTPGATTFYRGGVDGNHQFTVSGLPSSGTIYVRYYSRDDSASSWEFQQHNYTMDVGE